MMNRKTRFGSFYFVKITEETPMNSTIDFKTAKTVDTMSKKIDVIDDAGTGCF